MTVSPDDELLIEAACTARGDVALDGKLRAHPAWHDLGEDARSTAHDVASASRVLEAAMDPEGLSSTVRAVVRRIGGG
jgi:hypothetical protein